MPIFYYLCSRFSAIELPEHLCVFDNFLISMHIVLIIIIKCLNCLINHLYFAPVEKKLISFEKPGPAIHPSINNPPMYGTSGKISNQILMVIFLVWLKKKIEKFFH